jgi:hypothetical protein
MPFRSARTPPTGIEPGFDSKSRRPRPNMILRGQGRVFVMRTQSRRRKRRSRDADPAICWTSNENGVPMSDNTLNMALGIMGCDGPGGNHCTHGVCLTASTLLNEECEFDGDVVEPQLARNTEAKAPAARRGDAALLWKDGLTSHLIRPNPFVAISSSSLVFPN